MYFNRNAVFVMKKEQLLDVVLALVKKLFISTVVDKMVPCTSFLTAFSKKCTVFNIYFSKVLL